MPVWGESFIIGPLSPEQTCFHLHLLRSAEAGASDVGRRAPRPTLEALAFLTAGAGGEGRSPVRSRRRETEGFGGAGLQVPEVRWLGWVLGDLRIWLEP